MGIIFLYELEEEEGGSKRHTGVRVFLEGGNPFQMQECRCVMVRWNV